MRYFSKIEVDDVDDEEMDGCSYDWMIRTSLTTPAAINPDNGVGHKDTGWFTFLC